MFAFSFLAVAIAASPVFAAPAPVAECSLPSQPIVAPAGQTQVVLPTSIPDFSALGVGVQNYSCTDAGNYTSTGAFAEFFDISWLDFDNIEGDALGVWEELPSFVSVSRLITALRFLGDIDVLGQHYFISNPSGGLAAKFDFTSAGKTQGNPDAFVVAAKVGDLPAPTGPQDVDWLALNATSGELGSQVFRVNTRGGQPPSSCKPGSSPISVKYAARYLFFGSSL
ncbi:hypothetical protein FA95DRAFT_1602085 [Auriscalpium vulgare]|uniref:Uncharacterized protein n=1 Tax=Auriscalpium vulgare TaxID=40419 RepID=A0ACB8S7M0_9AGAM|nr:hypothetical protein FA95DRAFT_1602085 [Auriscalpium vulgare]